MLERVSRYLGAAALLLGSAGVLGQPASDMTGAQPRKPRQLVVSDKPRLGDWRPVLGSSAGLGLGVLE